MSDRRNEIWEERGTRAGNKVYNAVTYHPWLTGILTLLALGAIVLVLNVVGVFGGYASETKRLVSVPNTREQTTQVLNDWTSMQQAACNALAAKNADRTSDSPTLIEGPDFAYAAQYRRIKQDYDRRMSNFFEAYLTKKIPLPGTISNLPQVAPSLTAMEKQADC